MNFWKRFLTRVFGRRGGGSLFVARGEYLPSGNLRENEAVGAVANVIASNVGKLVPQHIREDGRGVTIVTDRLSRILSERPCPEMSAYDFLYRLASDAVYTSNAFAVVFYSDDCTEVERIQPVTVRSHRIIEDDAGNMMFRFIWDYDGEEYTVPYQSVIHIKMRYNKKRFLGTPPDADLSRSVELLDTSYKSVENVVNNSASLRGYLKYTNLASDSDIEDKVRAFKRAYMSAENDGGIAGIDSSYEFHEITQQPKQIPTPQVSFFRDNIYRYYGVSEKILTSTYSESEWNSFYESVIEPIAIQLSQEFSYKLFSARERGCGNKIVFTTNRLQYATVKTRADIGGSLFDRGIITINEYREMLYMPRIDGGDVRMISLNYVKTDDQTLYQTGRTSDGPRNVKSQIMEVCSIANRTDETAK